MLDILIIFLIIFLIIVLKNTELFSNYKRCKEIKGITKEVFDKHNINFVNNNDWDLFLPCGYKNAQNELNNFYETGKHIYSIEDCDKLTSKVKLWNMILEHYGRNQAVTIMPETFLLKKDADKQLFKKKYSPSEVYVMKNKKQRKLGIKLTNDLNEILTTKDYFLVQKMIHSHKINGYKYNFRCYLLVVCDKDTKFYLHDKIKYLYTLKKSSNNLLDKDQHIANGYSSEKNIYNKNPFYLDNNDIHLKIKQLLSKVLNSIKNKICLKLKNNTRFQLFGVDIMLDEQLHPYLLEMNKGPDMIPKNDEEVKLYRKVIEDVFDKVNLIHTDNNQFQKLK